MGEARITVARADDALVVAALALQCALDRGGSREPGFLDRYAGAWVARRQTHPVWVAEAGDQHAGYLQAAVVEPLPWPGQPVGAGAQLLVQSFFLRSEHRGHGIGEQLLMAAVQWARDSGLSSVVLSGGRQTRPMLERVGFVAVDDWFRMAW